MNLGQPAPRSESPAVSHDAATLADMPAEITNEIASYLSPGDLIRLSHADRLTRSRLKQVVRGALWAQRLKKANNLSEAAALMKEMCQVLETELPLHLRMDAVLNVVCQTFDVNSTEWAALFADVERTILGMQTNKRAECVFRIAETILKDITINVDEDFYGLEPRDPNQYNYIDRIVKKWLDDLPIADCARILAQVAQTAVRWVEIVRDSEVDATIIAFNTRLHELGDHPAAALVWREIGAICRQHADGMAMFDQYMEMLRTLNNPDVLMAGLAGLASGLPDYDEDPDTGEISERAVRVSQLCDNVIGGSTVDRAKVLALLVEFNSNSATGP
jgi:hypothetical protein